MLLIFCIFPLQLSWFLSLTSLVDATKSYMLDLNRNSPTCWEISLRVLLQKVRQDRYHSRCVKKKAGARCQALSLG